MKGTEIKSIGITNHARNKFRDRLFKLHEVAGYHDDVVKMIRFGKLNLDSAIAKLFGESRKLDMTNFGKKMKKRNKRHSGYLRFRGQTFDFIVENGVLVTVEIIVRDFRYINKEGGLTYR